MDRVMAMKGFRLFCRYCGGWKGIHCFLVGFDLVLLYLLLFIWKAASFENAFLSTT